MPKIGLRTIKTAVAVFITFLINIILYLISPNFANTWYSPFFASIAAVYSMQREFSQSFALARIRALGSIVGGLFGMVIILIYETFLSNIIIDQYGLIINMFVLYILTSIFIIILIYFLVKFKIKDLVFVAALTYLSVTISLRNDLPVVAFAVNRISSTIIGVLVTLGINNLHVHHHRNKNILFVSALDACLLNKEKSLSSYSQYHLSALLNDGLNFTISTTRTPSSLSRILYGLPLKNELMIMNGAVKYDIVKEKFLDIKYIKKSAQIGIDAYFSSINRNVFTYTIIDQALSIYHTDFENDLEEKFYYDRKNDYFRNHIKGKIDFNEDVVYYVLIDTLDKVHQYKKDLLDYYRAYISCQIYAYEEGSSYYFLKIYKSDISKKEALKAFVSKNPNEFLISFASKSYDLEMMSLSDFSFALASADEEVKAKADYLIPIDQADGVVRMIRKLYYARDYKMLLKKIKNSKNR
ncbi:MAG: HAD hydrolase family protein [Candidatus Izemoplasmatales bacterium]|uniref:HAD hydrolase family protein n=1 Tax=Hujiaoplasma nucleasis TaxID=2725268 RepID=A0A7L6N339_9MOLU|nr:HAD hydrolase family protein [Hujiaoplasma nucleasis]QLY39872.1 HAD hydrolase family protein [Hujiaoplasma nucleasis]